MIDFLKTEGHLKVQSEEIYENPVNILNFDNKHSVDNPDPYVIKYNGEYYCYSSSEGGPLGVNVLHSEDLINWERLGYALETEDQKDFWAPCVIYNNGIFYMYYSSIKSDEEDCHCEFMKVATSKSPTGPFKYKKTLFDTFSIDAHVIKDIDGTYYLIYSTNEYMGIDEKRPGTVIAADKLIDMMTPEGNPKLLIKPTIDEEIFEENRFGDGRDWHTIEGAFYFRKKDNAYIMYSGNAYTHEKYFVGYSKAAADCNTKFNEMKWEKYPDAYTFNPVLMKNEAVTGTGHNSVVKAPDNVEDWIVYHGRSLGFKERSMRIDPILWIGDEMWIPGPTYKTQDSPWMPAFRDLFHAELKKEWKILEGEWEIKDRAFTQSKLDGTARVLIKLPFDNYIFEVSAKCTPTHMGALYGVYLCYKDAQNYAEFILDAGKRCAKVISAVNGVQKLEEEEKLENGFDFKSYHRLLIEKLGSSFKIFIDDTFKFRILSSIKEGSPGLVTYYSKAQYAGVSVTNHIKLEEAFSEGFRNIVSIESNVSRSPWSVEKDVLICSRNSEEAKIIFKKAFLNRFKLSCNFIIKDALKSDRVDFYPLFESEGDYLLISIHKENNLVQIKHIENNVLIREDEFKLEKEFNFRAKHAFYVSKENEHIYVILDKYIVYDGNISIKNGRAAFYSNMCTEFHHIDITQR